ncbi:MAG: sulfotransferase [Rubrobacteraceae bacterium]
MAGTLARTLFLGGSPRSGTTALTDYLNQHESVLVCRERYKHIQARVDPGLFTFDRILDYVPRREGGETNTPREHHVELLAKKDPAKLRWIGDKHPGYVRSLGMLSENNPGSRFILTYRPLEEVAESFEARSKNPDDPWLGGKDGFALGIKFWNLAMRGAREFVESGVNPNVLIVGYHDFFYQNEACIPLLSRFLEIEFDERVRETWKAMTREFEGGRRRKKLLADEQVALITETKDSESEEWMLGRIEQQWEALGSGRPHTQDVDPRPEFAAGIVRETKRARAADLRKKQLETKAEVLEKRLYAERRKRERLEQRAENTSDRARRLRRNLEGIKSSRSWRLLQSLGGIRKIDPRSR